MNSTGAKDWKELSKAASQERDPAKLMQLIEQLNQALDRRYGRSDPRSERE
jgi:hypothetical protein